MLGCTRVICGPLVFQGAGAFVDDDMSVGNDTDHIFGILECRYTVACAGNDNVRASEYRRIGGFGINEVCMPITKSPRIGPI